MSLFDTGLYESSIFPNTAKILQKKIIALAVAGLVSGAAFAQTNVTLYGRVDLGYVYSKSDYKKFQGVEQGNGIGSGGSRIGFMGEENLGGGLKALFKYEWGTAADVGTGATGARYSYVGVAGDFGQVTLGRNGTPSDLYMGGTSPWGINGLEPINQFRSKMPVIDGVRWDNSIAYASPKFAGLDLMGIYSFGEKVNGEKLEDASGNTLGYGCSIAGNTQTCYGSAKTSDAGKLGLGIRYANGPLYLSAVYHLQRDDGSLTSRNRTRPAAAAPWGPWTNWNDDGDNGAKGWAFGGSYDFKVVKVYANYFRVKANHSDSDIEGSDKQTALSLSVGVPVSSAGTVVAQYAFVKDYQKIYGEDEDKAGKVVGYSVGYRHNLSKRTSLYTYISRFNNKQEGISGGWRKTDVDGEKQTNFTVGISHYF